MVQNNQCVCSLGKTAAQLKLEFELFLQAVNDENSPVVIHKPVVGFVVDQGWEYQNHVVKKRASHLVDEVLGFAVVCGPLGQGIKRNVVWVHVF